jgi:hypothetical protein
LHIIQQKLDQSSDDATKMTGMWMAPADGGHPF